MRQATHHIINDIGDHIRQILGQDLTPVAKARALVKAVGGVLGAGQGALCLWETGGVLSLSATWGLPRGLADRVRRIAADPPACPGEPLGRVGWTSIGGDVDMDSGWPALDRLCAELAGKGCMTLWPLPWAEGSGMCLLRFGQDPGLSEERAEAISNLLVLAAGAVVQQRRSQERRDDYRRLFKTSRDMVYLSSRDGRWLDVNPAGAEMLGYGSVEEVIGIPNIAEASYYHPAERAKFMQVIESKGSVQDYEVTFRRKDGSPIEVAITAQVRREGGKIAGYEGIIKDITRRKRAEEQAALQRRMLEKVLEVMPVAVFVLDKGHRITHWNRACEELTGYQRQQLLGTRDTWKVFNRPEGVSLADVLVDEDMDKLVEVYEDLKLRPSPVSPDAWEAEAHFDDLGGRPKDLFFTAAVLRDDEGRSVGAVEAIVDSTHIVKLEHRLAESEALYRTLVEANREGIALQQAHGFIFANQAFMQMFGLESLESSRGDFLELLAPDCRKAYLEWLRGLGGGYGSNKPTDIFEGQGLKKGDNFDLELIAAPTQYNGAEATLFTVRDVTLRKRMEEQLIRSERLAATGKLAFDIAHEVNNPLGGILTYAHLLQEDVGGDSEMNSTLDKIIKLTNRCKIIVRGLLDFAREDQPEREEMDLNRVLTEMLSLIEGHLVMRDVEVITDLDLRLPPFFGHRTKLEQVFLNTVINAAEAMEGQGRLTIATRQDPDKHELQIHFRDEGPGMSEDVIRRIFDPFFTTKERGRGTGLGLAISHGIIKQHGGSITVQSSPGRGTTFTITLPAPAA